MNIKLLTLGPQNFYHTSMETPEAKPKTQNPNLKYNPKPKFQNPKPKTLRVQPLISTDLLGLKSLLTKVMMIHYTIFPKCAENK